MSPDDPAPSRDDSGGGFYGHTVRRIKAIVDGPALSPLAARLACSEPLRDVERDRSG